MQIYKYKYSDTKQTSGFLEKRTFRLSLVVILGFTKLYRIWHLYKKKIGKKI